MPKTAGEVPGQQERQQGAEGRQHDRYLTGQYGKIGIAAVAAAVRYCDAGKNPAYAPVEPRNEHGLFERAA